MKVRNVMLPVIAVAAAAVGSICWWRTHEAARDAHSLPVSGSIEVTEVQSSFKQAGRLARRWVDEGEVVTAGQEIAVLDMSDLLIEQAAQSSAVCAARASLDQLEHGSRPEEISLARATLARHEAELVLAVAAFRRQESLLNTDVISSNDYDRAKSVLDVGTAQVQESRQNLKLFEEGPRIEQIEQGRAALALAAQQSAAVAQRLRDAVLVAQFRGVVLSKNAEQEEYLSAGTPVVALANLDEVWLRAYVNETDLNRVKLGQRAEVSVDSFSGKRYEGRITFISSEAEFTPKTVQTEKERVKLVYRIKITLANPNWELKPGMPADARIALD